MPEDIEILCKITIPMPTRQDRAILHNQWLLDTWSYKTQHHPTHSAPGSSHSVHPTHSTPGSSQSIHPTHSTPGSSQSVHPTHPAPGSSQSVHSTHCPLSQFTPHTVLSVSSPHTLSSQSVHPTHSNIIYNVII